MFKSENTRLKTFKQITLPYMKDLYTFALKLTKSKSEAEDLTQETYLRAFEKFDQFKSETKSRSWLFAIRYHLFIDSRRKAENKYIFVDLEESRSIDWNLTHFGGSSLPSDQKKNPHPFMAGARNPILFKVGFIQLKINSNLDSGLLNFNILLHILVDRFWRFLLFLI